MSKKQTYRKAVFLVTYKKEKSRVLYLLLRRKKHWKGWEFPKGGVEKGENLGKAAKRECKEESGLNPIKIKKFNISGKYKYHKKFADRKGFSGQTYTLFACQVPEGKVKIDKREHSGFKWLPFAKAIKKLTWKNQKICLRIVSRSLR